MVYGMVGSSTYYSPYLYSFAKQQDISVGSVLEMSELHDLFNLPLSEEAFEEFCELQTLVGIAD
jgi:hypothetical protein